ncbi:hypothetical protein, partial [Microseira wollei]|uniref:hypothetical protein n=1 Tax=Microseira wollei TaxID=467598 RepID=UPI001CFE48A0
NFDLVTKLTAAVPLLREWWRQIGTVGARHPKNFDLVTKLTAAVPLPPGYTGVFNWVQRDVVGARHP